MFELIKAWNAVIDAERRFEAAQEHLRGLLDNGAPSGEVETAALSVFQLEHARRRADALFSAELWRCQQRYRVDVLRLREWCRKRTTRDFEA